MTLLPKQSRGSGNSIAKRLFPEKVGTGRRYKISRIDEIIQAPRNDVLLCYEIDC